MRALSESVDGQVGSQPGYAWEKKWWEEAYDSKAKKMQVCSMKADPNQGSTMVLY
jgi:hypothetical protein